VSLIISRINSWASVDVIISLDNFVNTTQEIGLTENDAEKLIDILNSTYKRNTVTKVRRKRYRWEVGTLYER